DKEKHNSKKNRRHRYHRTNVKKNNNGSTPTQGNSGETPISPLYVDPLVDGPIMTANLAPFPLLGSAPLLPEFAQHHPFSPTFLQHQSYVHGQLYSPLPTQQKEENDNGGSSDEDSISIRRWTDGLRAISSKNNNDVSKMSQMFEEMERYVQAGHSNIPRLATSNIPALLCGVIQGQSQEHSEKTLLFPALQTVQKMIEHPQLHTIFSTLDIIKVYYFFLILKKKKPKNFFFFLKKKR
ncbi:hypothetical protein RFI_34811, partial [Reticulomyxa filosa]